MNIKKILREMADKDAEALITEKDRLFCLQLAQECEIKNIEKEPKRKRKKKNKDK